MQSLSRNGYTADAVKKALHAPNRVIAFRYDLLDSSNRLKRRLDNVLAASVSYDSTAEIKRTARFTVKDDGTINYLSDRIQPWVRLKMPDGGWVEWPMGVFLLSTSTKQIKNGMVIREIEAYDQLQVLKDDRVTGKYLIPAGTNFITAVKTLLEGAGITQHNLTPTTKTLPVDREWDGGTPKLEIINDLLAALNYDQLHFDESGYAVAKPYVSPDLRASEYTYRDDQDSVIWPEVEETLDLFNVPNQFVLIVSEPDRPVLKSIYTNENPNSPTSTVNRGRTIVDYRQVEAPDQATLDSLARTLAYKTSQVYQTVTFESAIMPMHSHNDVIMFEFSRLGISAKYEEIAWSFDLKAGARMRHVVRRVVSV